MEQVIAWSYQHRDGVSWSTVLLVTGLTLLSGIGWHIQQPAPDAFEIQAFLESSPPAQPETARPAETTPTPSRTPPQPATKAMPTAPAPSPLGQVKQDTPADGESATAAHAEGERATAARNAAAATSSHYEAQLLAYLEKIKRYPSSREARLTRPQGTVQVWLEIDRQGRLIDCGVLQSSGSNLLDAHALSMLRASRYPSFPEDAFHRETTHRFSAYLKFQIDS